MVQAELIIWNAQMPSLTMKVTWMPTWNIDSHKLGEMTIVVLLKAFVGTANPGVVASLSSVLQLFQPLLSACLSCCTRAHVEHATCNMILGSVPTNFFLVPQRIAVWGVRVTT